MRQWGVAEILPKTIWAERTGGADVGIVADPPRTRVYARACVRAGAIRVHQGDRSEGRLAKKQVKIGR